MNKRSGLSLVITLALLLPASSHFLCAAAQKNEAPAKRNAREQPTVSQAAAKITTTDTVKYSYEFAQPEFHVRRITIEHDAAGQGRISFARKGDTDDLSEPLEISATALARIAALWDALRFLDSTVDYQADKQFPHLGTMRLRMQRGAQQRSAEFNWTNDRAAKALVDEYRRAADQALFVFDINVARQNQSLETPKILDRLEILVTRSGLSDPRQLLSLLRDLQTDERIPLIARNKAEKLVKKIEKQKPTGD